MRALAKGALLLLLLSVGAKDFVSAQVTRFTFTENRKRLQVGGAYLGKYPMYGVNVGYGQNWAAGAIGYIEGEYARLSEADYREESVALKVGYLYPLFRVGGFAVRVGLAPYLAGRYQKSLIMDKELRIGSVGAEGKWEFELLFYRENGIFSGVRQSAEYTFTHDSFMFNYAFYCGIRIKI